MQINESTWCQLSLNVLLQARGKRIELPAEFLFQMVSLFEQLLTLTNQNLAFLLGQRVNLDVAFDYAFDFSKALLGVLGFLGFADK